MMSRRTSLKLAFLLLIPSFGINASQTQAIKSNEKTDNLGWNFYWEDPKPKKKMPVEKVEPPKVSLNNADKSIKPLSTEWFRKNIPILEQRAIDNPNAENMKALLLVEKMMGDKGEVFARKKNYYQSVIPELQEGIRLPITTPGVLAAKNFKSDQRRKALDEIGKTAGLVLFYDHNCAYCAGMIPHINRLHRLHKHNVYVIERNLNGARIPRLDSNIEVFPDDGQSDTFGISVWPALVMLNPPLDVMVVAQGNIYFSELEKRLINIAFETNILDRDWYYKVYPEEQGLVNDMQFADLPKDIENDPVRLVNHLTDLAANPEGTDSHLSNKKDLK